MARPSSLTPTLSTSASPSRAIVDSPLAALGWMTLSGLGFALMGVFVKRLSGRFPEPELLFFRSSINAVLVLAWMLAKREPVFPKGPKDIPLLLVRGFAGTGSVSCLFYTIRHVPLSIAILMNWSSPIFVILFSALFLKEKLPRALLAWIALCFAGLLCIVRPDMGHGAGGLPLFGVGIGVLGAIFAGTAYVAVRAATARLGVNVIVLYFVGVAAILSAPLAYRVYVAPTPGEWLELAGLGLSATFGQVTMTQGYRFAPAGLVSTLGLLTAAFGAIFGWMLFNEVLDPVQWVGMLLLAIGIAALTKPFEITRRVN